MEIENRRLTECKDGNSVVWDVADGREIVYIKFMDDRGEANRDILLETDSYKKAEQVYQNAKEYMED